MSNFSCASFVDSGEAPLELKWCCLAADQLPENAKSQARGFYGLLVSSVVQTTLFGVVFDPGCFVLLFHF